MIEVRTSGLAIFGYENGEYYFRVGKNPEKTKLSFSGIPFEYIPYINELKKKVERKQKLQKLLET